jgi:hypothetical protein
VATVVLKTGYFVDLQPSAGGANVDECLDLETLAVRRDEGQVPSPKGVVPIAKVAVLASPDTVDELGQGPVANTTDPSDVCAPAAGNEARAFREVGACE